MGSPSRSIYTSFAFMRRPLDEFHMTRDAQIDAFLLKNPAGIAQDSTQVVHLPARHSDNVFARHIRHALAGLSVQVPAAVGRGGLGHSSENLKGVIKPFPRSPLVGLAVRQILVPPRGDVE